MSKSWNRLETHLLVGVLGLGGLVALVLGLHAFMVGTATPLHSDPTRVPSVVDSEPNRRWAAAVERAREILRAGMVEQNLPGLSVAVGVGDDLVWAEGFGWADLEGLVPVRPATRFRIGTTSIVLTSAAVGLLVEQGRLRLDDEIQVYVPEFPRKPWPVALRQVMAHVAGLRSDGGDESPLFARHCDQPVEGFSDVAGRPLLFEPGREFHRSRYGWILVSAAVEAAAREPFFVFMRRAVFEPLGMRATSTDAEAEGVVDRATSYFPRYAANPRYGLHLVREIDLSCYAGAMAFVSTSEDLVRFGLAIRSGRLLRPDTVQQFQTPQRLASGKQTPSGLGWDVETVTLAGRRVRAVGQTGDLLGGPVASLVIFPDPRLVVALVSNIAYADTWPLALRVAEAFVERGA